MNKFVCTLAVVLLFSAPVSAEPTLTEDVVKEISAELLVAVQEADMSVFEKYLHPSSKIVIDMDPSPSAGQMEVEYEQYMGLLAMSLPMLQNSQIDEEIISISVDEANNQATIREKVSATVEMMGTKVRDVSISETTYGVLDGQIKVITATDELISSEVIE